MITIKWQLVPKVGVSPDKSEKRICLGLANFTEYAILINQGPTPSPENRKDMYPEWYESVWKQLLIDGHPIAGVILWCFDCPFSLIGKVSAVSSGAETNDLIIFQLCVVL